MRSYDHAGSSASVIANPQAEAAILSAFLLHDGPLARAAERLSPDDFSIPLFGRIYELMLSELSLGRRPSPLSIATALTTDSDLAERGGLAYLLKLTSPASLIYAGEGIEQVAELAQRRRLSLALEQVQHELREDAGGLPAILEQLEAASAGATKDDRARPAMTIGAALKETVARTWDIKEGRAQPALMLPSSLRDWNDVTGGMRAGDLILLGGRPGMSKTTWSLAIARRAAQAGYGVLYISREMKTEQLAIRVAADMLFEAASQVTFEQVKLGTIDAAGMRRLQDVQQAAEALPLIVEQPASLSVTRLGAMVRRHKRGMEARDWKLGLVIVDYLGLLEPPPGKGNREQEVSAISRELKSVAGAADVPLIALTQLSRAVEQREDKRPQLSDLRDSGSLEQDADCVVFLYREAYYLQNTRPDPTDGAKYAEWEARLATVKDRVEVYSAKVRQGAPTRRNAYFFGERQAIRNSDFLETGRH